MKLSKLSLQSLQEANRKGCTCFGIFTNTECMKLMSFGQAYNPYTLFVQK